MGISRRTLLRQFVWVSAGVVVLPSCLHDKRKASVLLTNMKISAGQEELLAAIADSLIPQTKTPGARDIGAAEFAWKMLDDCKSAAEQQRFLKGLSAIDQQCQDKFGHSFHAASIDQREAILADLEAAAGKSDEAYCYHTLKGLCIQAYTTSQFYLTKVQVYQLVPGVFKGCVPVTTA